MLLELVQNKLQEMNTSYSICERIVWNELVVSVVMKMKYSAEYGIVSGTTSLLITSARELWKIDEAFNQLVRRCMR